MTGLPEPAEPKNRRGLTLTAVGITAALLAGMPAAAANTVDTPEDIDSADTSEEEVNDTADGVEDGAAEGAEDQAGENSASEDTDAENTGSEDESTQDEEILEDAEETSDVVELQILSTNDFHGRVEANGNTAGSEIFACTVDHFRAQNPNTLLVGAGDHIGASTFTP
ncbi:hypothetical protein [Nesterenkonia flava]|uniref:Bifunctional metallophosphatase/5'-nucleotidase n=1 Tax=Nesterenkonia flava TaxID=469799 RepID=A0ABU1FT88_9MICC|nr:hypothetical protein [Nesterenkonia flava]MDR5711879.1 hypothetical protein [Nesterenkonia flava]